jgi:uridine kinase
MIRWAPHKTGVLDALATEILHNYGRGRIVVAVDGLAASGTRAFADDLAEAIRRSDHSVFRASMADFRPPMLLNHPNVSEPPEDAYDYQTLRRVLLEPFRDGGTGSFVLAAFDTERNAQIEQKWATAKPDSILIVDGEFLQQPELRGLWNYSVWLEVPAQPTATEARYLKQSKPSALASAILDNSDPDAPQRVHADSC